MSKLKKGNLGISLVANIISVIVSAFVSFIITKYIVEAAGSTAYSFYPIATNFANYFSIIFISVNAMSARFITIELLDGREEEAKKYFVSVFFADVFISILLGILLFIFILRIDSILNIPVGLLPEIRKLFIYILIMVIVNGLSSVYLVAPYAKNRMDISGVNTIIQNVLKLIIFLVLLYRGNFRIEHYGLVLLIAAIINFILFYFTTKQLLPGFVMDIRYFSKNHIKEVVSSGFWIMVNRSGILLINNAQLIVVNMILGADASGPLALTQPIYTFISLFGTMIANIVTPFVVRTVAQKKETFGKDVHYIQLLITLSIGALCSIVMGFGEQFYHLWLPKEDAHLLYLLSYFNVLQLLITYITTFYNAFLTALNKVKTPSIIMLVFGVIGIGIMFLLLKFTNLGIIGMLIANNITYFIYYFIFQTYYSYQQVDTDLQPYKKELQIQRILVATVLFVGINTILGRLIPMPNYLSLLGICGILGCIEIYAILRMNHVKLVEFIAFIRN